MGFESGTMGFRLFYLPRPLPDDAVKRFAAHAACGLDAIQAEESAGWVTGRHLLDRNITEDSITYAGYLRITLRQGQRKIPTSLLQAECRMEELAACAAEGHAFVNRRKRAEIREAVTERLLPNMPPQLKGIPLVHQPGSSVLYAGAMSETQSDLLCARFTQTMGYHLIPVTPESAAVSLRKVDVHDLLPVSFSPDVDDALMESQPGRDFLTWLWFKSESGKGTVRLPDIGDLGVLLEGPLTFMHEGSGAHVIVLRKGEPIGSAEAKTCLLSGKKLKQSKLTFGLGDELWKCMFDADGFICRGLTVPEEEGSLDPMSRFQSRIRQLDRFRDMLFALYDRFLEERTDKAGWPGAKKKIREWAKARASRV
jgi:hypothetical protein